MEQNAHEMERSIGRRVDFLPIPPHDDPRVPQRNAIARSIMTDGPTAHERDARQRRHACTQADDLPPRHHHPVPAVALQRASPTSTASSFSPLSSILSPPACGGHAICARNQPDSRHHAQSQRHAPPQPYAAAASQPCQRQDACAYTATDATRPPRTRSIPQGCGRATTPCVGPYITGCASEGKPHERLACVPVRQGAATSQQQQQQQQPTRCELASSSPPRYPPRPPKLTVPYVDSGCAQRAEAPRTACVSATPHDADTWGPASCRSRSPSPPAAAWHAAETTSPFTGPTALTHRPIQWIPTTAFAAINRMDPAVRHHFGTSFAAADGATEPTAQRALAGDVPHDAASNQSAWQQPAPGYFGQEEQQPHRQTSPRPPQPLSSNNMADAGQAVHAFDSNDLLDAVRAVMGMVTLVQTIHVFRRIAARQTRYMHVSPYGTPSPAL